MEDECMNCGEPFEQNVERLGKHRHPTHRDFCQACVSACAGAVGHEHACMVCMDTGDR